MVKRVNFSLFLILLFILLVPGIRLLSSNAVLAAGILLLVLTIWAIIDKHYMDSIISGTILVLLLVTKLRFSQTPELILLLRLSSILSFILLNITLAIGPLARFNNNFALAIKHRRHIGVTSFLLGFTHAYFIVTTNLYGNLFQMIPIPFIFFGFTSLYIITLLALTSWNSVQRSQNLKVWNIFHIGSLIVYLGFLYYFFNNTQMEITVIQKSVLIGIVGYWLILSPVISQRIKKITGWKQMHFLVYAAYISVIFHISHGILPMQPFWVKLVFWLLTGAVLSLHLAGWIVKLKKINELKNTNSNTS